MSEEINTPEVLEGKTLSEISDVFKSLMDSADRMLRSKEAESIKSAFYKLLGKLKSEAGEVTDAFDEVEENFKSLYSDYKRERAEYNKEQDALKEENLEKKKAIIEELKTGGRIGVVNACLRLKIATQGNVRFSIESEKGIGTTVTVNIPREYVNEKSIAR